MDKKYFPAQKAFFLWFIANLFFALQFILRLSVGLLREEIIAKFAINVVDFSALSGYYYLGYASSQIPLGMMLDRFNFRLVTFSSIALTVIGTLLFAWTANWQLLVFSRFLIGVGSGVAFLAIAKIVKNYFAPAYQPLMLSLSFSFGLIGAVFGAAPTQYFLNQYGYLSLFNLLALSCFLVGVMILLFSEIESENIERKSTWSLLKLVINPQIITIAICGGLMVGSLEGFADVWALAFFENYLRFSRLDSSLITSFVYIGMCVGGPILTMIAKYLDSANLTIFLTGILMIIIFILLFFLPTANLTFVNNSILMFILGILCCYQVLVFILAAHYVEASVVSLAIAVINCINMSFGYFFHAIIAYLFTAQTLPKQSLLGQISEAQLGNNLIYALSVIPVCTFIGQIGFLFLANNRGKVDNRK